MPYKFATLGMTLAEMREEKEKEEEKGEEKRR
jgi:hypothetical protein